MDSIITHKNQITAVGLLLSKKPLTEPKFESATKVVPISVPLVSHISKL